MLVELPIAKNKNIHQVFALILYIVYFGKTISPKINTTNIEEKLQCVAYKTENNINQVSGSTLPLMSKIVWCLQSK
jgi:Na+/H+ antiporter NhaC